MTTLSESVDFLNQVIETIDFATAKQPLIVGISGPQGSGKLYLADSLQTSLQQQHGLNVVKFLIDDLYLTYEEQQELTALANKTDNKLLRGRGLPGTHDVALLTKIMEDLIARKSVLIPQYDKSCYDGLGDRAPQNEWLVVDKRVDIVLFEGWFVGYQALNDDLIRLNYLRAGPFSVIQSNRLYEIEQINEYLKQYHSIWDTFDKFIILKSDDVNNVYKWRIEQEHALVKKVGEGMSDDKVREFVNRYMPCYYLYYEYVCDHGVVKDRLGNLRIIIDTHRKVVELDVFGDTPTDDTISEADNV